MASPSKNFNFPVSNSIPEDDYSENGEESGPADTIPREEFQTRFLLQTKAKAKRKLGRTTSCSSALKTNYLPSASTNVKALYNAPQSFMKNKRASRTGRRGLPKKGGAGGKAVWGKPGIEYMDEGYRLTDSHDPNYNSESDLEAGVFGDIVTFEMTDEELEGLIDPVVHEYLENLDFDSVVDILERDNMVKFSFKLVCRVINLAMDKRDPERELASRLISDLFGMGLLTSKDVARAFCYLLDQLADLTIDLPEAPCILGKFIARAIADDCIPPRYITDQEELVSDSSIEIIYCLRTANQLIQKDRGLVALDNIWHAEFRRPVKYLMRQIHSILKEYVVSNEVDAVFVALKELQIPHFHHEVVYELIIMCMEIEKPDVTEQLLELLYKLCFSATITINEFELGIRRVYEDLSDLAIDIPHAYILIELISKKLLDMAIMERHLFDVLSSKHGVGRKRFVSEGDGFQYTDVF